MTRIDVHLPKLLCDQHLLSNHREIKRICSRMRQRAASKNFKDIPHRFYTPSKDSGSEGKFHELFWLDKGHWTLNRYMELYDECLVRGFDVTDYRHNWDVYKEFPQFDNDFKPTEYHYKLLGERIDARLKTMKTIRYYGKTMGYDEFTQGIFLCGLRTF